MKIPIIPPEEMIEKERNVKEIEETNKLEEAMGGWRFTSRSIKQMKKLNQKTKTIDTEYGSILCGDNKTKKIDLFSECIGTECNIRFVGRKCPKDKTELGNFHTHPRNVIAYFSDTDIIGEDKINCLGTPNAEKENEKLVCIVPTKESLKHEISERRMDELVISQLTRIAEDKYGYVRDLEEIIEDDYHRFNPEKFKNNL
jgi:hypothetical protein